MILETSSYLRRHGKAGSSFFQRAHPERTWLQLHDLDWQNTSRNTPSSGTDFFVTTRHQWQDIFRMTRYTSSRAAIKLGRTAFVRFLATQKTQANLLKCDIVIVVRPNGRTTGRLLQNLVLWLRLATGHSVCSYVVYGSLWAIACGRKGFHWSKEAHFTTYWPLPF